MRIYKAVINWKSLTAQIWVDDVPQPLDVSLYNEAAALEFADHCFKAGVRVTFAK